MINFLCFVQWFLWELLHEILLELNPKGMLDHHWNWKLYPQKAIHRLSKRFGSVNNYLKHQNLNTFVSLVFKPFNH